MAEKKKAVVIEPIAAVSNGELQAVVDKLNEVIDYLNKN